MLSYHLHVQSQLICKTILNILCLLFPFFVFLNVPFRTSDILSMMTSHMRHVILHVRGVSEGNRFVNICNNLNVNNNLVWPRDFKSFQGAKFNTI